MDFHVDVYFEPISLVYFAFFFGSAFVLLATLHINFLVWNTLQNVKAYLRRAAAREMLGYYKQAIEGKFLHHIHIQLIPSD